MVLDDATSYRDRVHVIVGTPNEVANTRVRLAAQQESGRIYLAAVVTDPTAWQQYTLQRSFVQTVPSVVVNLLSMQAVANSSAIVARLHHAGQQSEASFARIEIR